MSNQRLENYKHTDVTEKIIGAAINVHSAMGNGFPEVIYQRALQIELETQSIVFRREIEMPVYYHEVEVGRRRVDFLVENKVLVELKALSQVDEVQYNQILNYLTAYKLEVGLLINFGEKRLSWKRFVKTLQPPSFPSASSNNHN